MSIVALAPLPMPTAWTGEPSSYSCVVSQWGRIEIRIRPNDQIQYDLIHQGKLLSLTHQPARIGRPEMFAGHSRSSNAGIDDPEFWNPKLRSPICFNAAADAVLSPTDY